MKTIFMTIEFFIFLDYLFVPIMFSKIKKSGNFNFLFNSFHKIFLFTVLLIIGNYTVFEYHQNILFNLIFCIVFAFLLNYNFNINSLFKEDSNYDISLMTSDGAEIMKSVIEEMKNQYKKSTIQKLKDIINNFLIDMFQDVITAFYLVKNKNEFKKRLQEINKTMGYSDFLSSLNYKDFFIMFRSRFVCNLLVIFIIQLSIVCIK